MAAWDTYQFTLNGGSLTIPAGATATGTVNGVSVVREAAPPDIFTYYHVELDGQELLLAEGVAAESFLPGAEDLRFDNIADRPASAPEMPEMSYPRIKAARQLPMEVRRLLAARASATVAKAAAA